MSSKKYIRLNDSEVMYLQWVLSQHLLCSDCRNANRFLASRYPLIHMSKVDDLKTALSGGLLSLINKVAFIKQIIKSIH